MVNELILNNEKICLFYLVDKTLSLLSTVEWKNNKVVTIAGSSGLEELFYGKPFLIFTNLIYSFIP
jgi:hypothetical protein